MVAPLHPLYFFKGYSSDFDLGGDSNDRLQRLDQSADVYASSSQKATLCVIRTLVDHKRLVKWYVS